MIINNDTLPTEDIIPITFIGGTGGNFLCHFIVSAKRNIQDIIELSEHGNAHENCLKDLSGLHFSASYPDNKKIDSILSGILIYDMAKKPYYTSSHIADINLININFKRSIRIIYELDDVQEISTVFYGKFYIDESNTPVKSHHKFNKLNLIRWQSKFNYIENMPNVLFISWKELFKGNIEELITKLSIFTEIDINNFSRESLMHWRDKTQYCIDKFTNNC
jgi:hypothetical protein